MASLNAYGDSSDGALEKKFGLSISSQRLDDLDRACLDFVRASAKPVKCLDIGCGEGAMSVRMAEAGGDVIGIDLNPPLTDEAAIQFRQQDLRHIDWKIIGAYEVLYSQRTLNYVPYQDMIDFLTEARLGLTPMGKAYLSCGGLNTEYHDAYADRYLPPERRYGHLSPDMAEKHGIHFPVCFLTVDEFGEMVEKAGFVSERVWASPFGNCKGIFYNP